MAKILVFDAYGTLFDPISDQRRLELTCPGYGAVLSQLWRLKQLEYSWLRSLMGGAFVDFWTVTRQALRFALTSAGFLLSDADIDDLAGEYLRLAPFAEVRTALSELKHRGVRCAILSNGSRRMLDELVAHTGLGDLLVQPVSVDDAGVFKPHPATYALVEAKLGVARSDVVFVSTNFWDICGAKRFGFTTIWLNRTPPEASLAPVTPAELYRLQRGQPEQLDLEPDFTASSVAFSQDLLSAIGI